MSESRVRDIVIRLQLTRPPRGLSRSPDDRKRRYDVRLYSARPIPGVEPPSPEIQERAPSIAGLSLVGSEWIEMPWALYQEYLELFVEGEKARHYMSQRLFSTLSPGVQGIFKGAIGDGSRTTCLWWSAETPELDDMPWELMSASGNLPPERFLFVRGLPPESPPPPPPLGPRLRLALLYDPEFAPEPLLRAIGSLSPAFEVRYIKSRLREGLQSAVREGFELVHIVAGGFVSSAYEGVLYLNDPRNRDARPDFSAAELSTLLRGSRVVLVGLTDARFAGPDGAPSGDASPTVYRAFALFAGCRHELPTLVAPLGPLSDGETQKFWSGFYEGLGRTRGVHGAMLAGRGGALLPVAVYLRQRGARLFARQSRGGPAEVAPRAVAAQLEQSRALIDDVQALGERFGHLPTGLADFLSRESRRQEKLQEQLKPWADADADEDA